MLREICPKEIKSSKYHYENEYLVLEDNFREEILNLVWRLLVDKVGKTQGKFDYCLVEFTSPKWKETLLKYFKNLLDKDTRMIFIEIDRENALERNRLREDKDRVPEIYIRMFNESYQAVGKLFSKKLILDNNGKIEYLRESVKKIWLWLVD